MTPRAGRLAAGVGLGLAAAGLLALQGPGVDAAIRRGLRVGERPPAFSVQDLTGISQSLSQYEGQTIVLHFWATWCPYCQREIPKLEQVHREFQHDAVQVLAVSIDEDVHVLRHFVLQRRLTYPVIADAEDGFRLSDRYRINGIPVTYVIGPDGVTDVRLVGSSDILGAIRRTLAASL